MLLEADWVLPISRPPIEDGAVLVSGGAIEDVGPAARLRTRYPGAAVESYAGCMLLPGLVNTHTHLDYSAFRGFARPSGFGEWMLRLLLARRKLDADDYAASALWGAHECVRSGVTSIADTSYDGWTVARAAGVAGLRARVYLELFGLDDAVLPVTMERFEEGLSRLRSECEAIGVAGPRAADRDEAAWAGTVATPDGEGHGSIVEPGISPHAPYTVSARLYREAARLAQRAGLRLATHVAESQAEVELLAGGTSAIAQAYKAARLWTGERWGAPGVRPMAYVAAAGALGPETLVVHAVQVDADDIAMLAKSGAATAHCPRSNRRLRCGVAPVVEMLAAGITVGLGTDSLSSNDSLDMFAEMRMALEVSKARGAERARGGVRDVDGRGAGRDDLARHSDQTTLVAADVLRMATLDGARAMGWDHLVGSLDVGKRADIIAVRVSSLPDEDPTAALVGTASATNVRMTMVDGVRVACGGAVPVDVVEGLASARGKLGLTTRAT